MINFEENESSSGDLIELTIKTLNEADIKIQVSQNQSIISVKELISTTTSISVDRQRLIFRGQVLQDDRLLESYGISAGHALHMVAKPENYRELQAAASPPAAAQSSPLSYFSSLGIGNSLGSSPAAQLNASAATGTVAATENDTSNNSNSNRPQSMEHIRQNLLTIRTLMSTMRNSVSNSNSEGAANSSQQNTDLPTTENLESEHSVPEGSSTIDSEVNGTNDANSESAVNTTANNNHDLREQEFSLNSLQFYVGQWIDVKDTVQQWLEATILQIDNEQRRVFVTYNGWPHRWDEWISMDSPRIAPFRTRSTATVSVESILSPTVNTPLTEQPPTGIDDIRSLLPEVGRVVSDLDRRIGQIVRANAENTNRSPFVGLPLTGNSSDPENTNYQNFMSVVNGNFPWSNLLQDNYNMHREESNASDHSNQELPTIASSSESQTTSLPSAATVNTSNTSNTTSASGSSHAEQLSMVGDIAKLRELIPLLDRGGRLLCDLAAELKRNIDVHAPPSTTNTSTAATNNASSGSNITSSLEEAIANLMRPRPPSPTQNEVYHSLVRPPSSASSGLNSLSNLIFNNGSRAGGSNRGHMDIHIAIITPQRSNGSGSGLSPAVLQSLLNSSNSITTASTTNNNNTNTSNSSNISGVASSIANQSLWPSSGLGTALGPNSISGNSTINSNSDNRMSTANYLRYPFGQADNGNADESQMPPPASLTSSATSATSATSTSTSPLTHSAWRSLRDNPRLRYNATTESSDSTQMFEPLLGDINASSSGTGNDLRTEAYLTNELSAQRLDGNSNSSNNDNQANLINQFYDYLVGNISELSTGPQTSNNNNRHEDDDDDDDEDDDDDLDNDDESYSAIYFPTERSNASTNNYADVDDEVNYGGTTLCNVHQSVNSSTTSSYVSNTEENDIEYDNDSASYDCHDVDSQGFQSCDNEHDHTDNFHENDSDDNIMDVIEDLLPSNNASANNNSSNSTQGNSIDSSSNNCSKINGNSNSSNSQEINSKFGIKTTDRVISFESRFENFASDLISSTNESSVRKIQESQTNDTVNENGSDNIVANNNDDININNSDIGNNSSEAGSEGNGSAQAEQSTDQSTGEAEASNSSSTSGGRSFFQRIRRSFYLG